jgi:hypothetical protein
MSKEFKLEFKRTLSGHLRADFTDDYGEPCILKGSEAQQKVWLKSPSSDRPCLNREMAKEIGFALIRFAKNGSLAEPTPEQQLAHFQAVMDEHDEYYQLQCAVVEDAREFIGLTSALLQAYQDDYRADGDYCHDLQGQIAAAEQSLGDTVEELETWMKEHGWEVMEKAELAAGRIGELLNSYKDAANTIGGRAKRLQSERDELQAQLAVKESTIADLKDLAYERAPRIAAEEAGKVREELEAQLREANAKLERTWSHREIARLKGELEIAWGQAEAGDRLREKAEARESRLRAALEAILREPYGCPFCNSGKLRNPLKTHTDDCGYALAPAALAEKEAPTQ